MNVLQTIPNMLASWGGPCTCTCDLLDGLYSIGGKVDLLTSDAVKEGDIVLGKGRPWMKLVPFDWKTPLAFSRNFRDYLLANEYDIYHANTIWLYPSHITCKIAREKKRPYLLSPHGMLYPTALKISAWKKWPMKKIWFDNDIRNAACIHATCEQEMLYIREYGYCGPIAIIPNPVVFPEGIGMKSILPSKKIIGYLGRLHPIKKIENLLIGVAEVVNKGYRDFVVEIMGKGVDEYESFLRKEVARLGLDDIVEFVGFVNGFEKYEHLSKCRALFVPSEQENFGMIIPEALICGTPVYASLGTPWKKLNEYGCGWWCDNSPETIASILCEVINMTDNKILEMGYKGRKFVENNYQVNVIAEKMLNLYEWILGNGIKPSFIYE